MIFPGSARLLPRSRRLSCLPLSHTPPSTLTSQRLSQCKRGDPTTLTLRPAAFTAIFRNHQCPLGMPITTCPQIPLSRTTTTRSSSLLRVTGGATPALLSTGIHPTKRPLHLPTHNLSISLLKTRLSFHLQKFNNLQLLSITHTLLLRLIQVQLNLFHSNLSLK